jgi:hypothetical protein
VKKWVHELNMEFSKEEIKMASKYLKKCSNSLAKKRWKSKHHLDFILPQLEWPESRVITATNAGEDVVKQDPLCMVGGNAKISTTTMKSSMEIPQKTRGRIAR